MRSAALRVVERAAQQEVPRGALMQRAGDAAARLAVASSLERTGPVLVLAGPGNNGGDALVAACALRERGIDVCVALLGRGDDYEGDALHAWRRWNADTVADPIAVLPHATLVVDGLFGIGIKRAPEGKALAWIAAVNGSPCPVLALDVPSGLDADTGHVAGTAIEADHTLTFIADKPGLHTGEGPDHSGTVIVDTLDVKMVDATNLPPGTVGVLNGPSSFAGVLKARRRNTNKGSFGSVAVIGGNEGMVGAALLASRMALHSGAGRVYVKFVGGDAPTFDVLHPELMIRASLDGVDADAVAIGPGLGRDADALALLDARLDAPGALAIDADALNAIAKDPSFMRKLASRAARGLPVAVLTPHPLEAARLLDRDVKAVQADRIEAATTLAARAGSVVVLKGVGTVIAAVDGTWAINPTGNPGLATGGTGDVLCGLVAGLLAQHAPPWEAACAAVWLHGAAADDLVAAGIGPAGLTASELVPAIRARLNREVR